MDTNFVLQRIGMAIGLGLLIGLQRQLVASELAGIRTFPLIALFGAFASLLALKFGGWVLAIAAAAMALVIYAGNVQLRGKDVSESPGITTEVAALVTFGIGAYLIIGEPVVAMIASGATAVLLQFKEPLHRFVSKIGDRDAHAIAQFVLIALVILPVLPNKAYGPYQVINPFEIWTVVVLIVGMGLAAYVAQRIFGSRAGALLGGILGGLISSTATAVAYARRSKQDGGSFASSATVILIASTVVFARIIVEILFVASNKAMQLIPPIAALLVVMIIIAGIFYIRHTKQISYEQSEPGGNPADLRGALVFGLIYSAVIFAVAAGKDLFGDRALYIVSVISGLTDVDALTLSTGQLANQDRIDPIVASQLITVGALSNLAFKAGIVASLGEKQLGRTVIFAFTLAIVCGIAILIGWHFVAPASQ